MATTTRQSIYATAICDAHYDYNHFAAVCVNVHDVSPSLCLSGSLAVYNSKKNIISRN